jgi:hypothetical protein
MQRMGIFASLNKRRRSWARFKILPCLRHSPPTRIQGTKKKKTRRVGALRRARLPSALSSYGVGGVLHVHGHCASDAWFCPVMRTVHRV